ncbi:MAG: hypothetical protein AAFW01_02160 [Pseudomonadota bacterium]
MLDILSLPAPLLALLSAGLVVAASLGSYGLARFALATKLGEETRELAGSVMFRVAALHGLMLALVFAQELAALRDVKVAAAHEAARVADIYYDAKRFGTAESAVISDHMARYGRIVFEQEWPQLAMTRRLSDEAWFEWDSAYDKILDLEPETARQQRLLEVMLLDIRELSALREARENAALGGLSPLFFVAAITGVMLISAAYFTWAPTALNLSLIAGFAGYTGLILYFIVTFANPYLPPGHAAPIGFERFLTDEVRARSE